MKLRYVDALRGIAIFGVIMVHTSQYGGGYPPRLVQLFEHGARGVQLFFVASAFTLFLSFDQRLNKEKRPIRNFYLRRFFRIAPMYYLGIIYYLFQDGFGPRHWLGDAPGISIQNILANLTFLHGFNPYFITSLVPGGWSIAIEMTFYALLPLLYRSINNTEDALRFSIFSVTIYFAFNFIFTRIHVITDDFLWNSYLSFYLPSQLPVFSFGILGYYLIVKRDFRISGISSLLLFVILIIQLIWGIMHQHILVGATFILLMIALSKYEFGILVNPITTFFGRISYSAYLVHFAVLNWLNKFGLFDVININGDSTGLFNFIVKFLIVLLVTSVLASFTFRVVERPLQRFGKQIIHKLETSWS